MTPALAAVSPALVQTPVEPPAPPVRSLSLAELAATRVQDTDLPIQVTNRAAEAGSPGAMGDRILDTVARMRQHHQAELKGLPGAALTGQSRPPAVDAPGPAAASVGDAAAMGDRFAAAMTRIVQFNASLLQFSVASSAVSSAGHSFNQFIRGQ